MVARVVADPTEEAAETAGALRAAVQRHPFHAAAKHILRRRGVPVGPDVRAPLRALDDAERAELDRTVAALVPSLAPLPADA